MPHGHLQTHVAPMPPHAAVSVVAGQSTTGAGGDIAVSLDAPPAPYASFAPLGGFAPYPAVGAPYGPSSMVYPPSGVATAFPAVSAVPVDVSLVYRAPSEHDVGGDGSGAPVVFDASVAAGNSAGAVKKQPLGFDAAVARTLEESWGVTTRALKPFYAVDRAIFADGRMVGVLEIKCRNYAFAALDSMGGLIISAHKVMAASQWHRVQRMTFVLALGLSASMNAPIPEPKFGVFRM